VSNLNFLIFWKFVSSFSCCVFTWVYCGKIACRHFGLNWAFVDPKTPVQPGVKFCVCVKELFPWLMMPLQVVYVNETAKAKNRRASFGFGSGTLHGHLLVTPFSSVLLFFFSSNSFYLGPLIIFFKLFFYRLNIFLVF